MIFKYIFNSEIEGIKYKKEVENYVKYTYLNDHSVISRMYNILLHRINISPSYPFFYPFTTSYALANCIILNLTNKFIY